MQLSLRIVQTRQFDAINFENTELKLATLWDVTPGDKVQVQGFSNQLNENYRRRLMELGFHEGEAVTCVQAPRLGAPRLYRVQNTIYSLDDNIAKLIDIGQNIDNG